METGESVHVRGRDDAAAGAVDGGSGGVIELALGDVECPLCMDVLFKPIAAACGHTFCRACILRAFDHAARLQCPLCRAPLAVDADHPPNVLLEALIGRLFPRATERRRQEEAALSSTSFARMPVFAIETAVFPLRQVDLHVFEPRYKLMLRRCLAGSRKFIIPMYVHSEYGVVVRIREHTPLPDGRSLMQGFAEQRARLHEWGEQDGYLVCRVEPLDNGQDEARARGDDEYDEELDADALADVDEEKRRVLVLLRQLLLRQPATDADDPQPSLDLSALPDRARDGLESNTLDMSVDSDRLAFWVGAMACGRGHLPRAVNGIMARRSRAGRICAARAVLDEMSAAFCSIQ
eukprot:TRINITY_DN2943_c0_g1_i1.p1 TRINITY_DN2943_c0_g1~~TRINITY_DN2943_c0_g1_i1.p1  ORF type:complete len:375 (+),score=123.56 TRINITY_DN2943_c0_g1_i1:78-1127(+)